eukprot:scaffold67239_cov35-Attheya_sp.AAC.3
MSTERHSLYDAATSRSDSVTMALMALVLILGWTPIILTIFHSLCGVSTCSRRRFLSASCSWGVSGKMRGNPSSPPSVNLMCTLSRLRADLRGVWNEASAAYT